MLMPIANRFNAFTPDKAVPIPAKPLQFGLRMATEQENRGILVNACTDLFLARYLFNTFKDNALPVMSAVMFFCQQSIEKLLKVALMQRGVSPQIRLISQSHNLRALSDVLAERSDKWVPSHQQLMQLQNLSPAVNDYRYSVGATMNKAAETLRITENLWRALFRQIVLNGHLRDVLRSRMSWVRQFAPFNARRSQNHPLIQMVVR